MVADGKQPIRVPVVEDSPADVEPGADRRRLKAWNRRLVPGAAACAVLLALVGAGAQPVLFSPRGMVLDAPVPESPVATPSGAGGGSSAAGTMEPYDEDDGAPYADAYGGYGDEYGGEYGDDPYGGAYGPAEEDEGEAGLVSSAYSYLSSYAAEPRPDPDPQWREKALERIRRIRMAPLTVRVADRYGKPVPGAVVRAVLQRHEFGFGSAVAARFLVGPEPDRDRYRSAFLELFGKATIESDLKWPHWEDAESRPYAMAALDWLEQHEIPVRGHCLVWGAWSYLPFDLALLKHDPEALKQRVETHLHDQLGALRGRIVEWDVVNEPYLQDDLQRVVGEDQMVRWFEIAREQDPTTRLFINEYGILPGYEYTKAAYEGHIRDLLAAGAPVEGIGLQGHFSYTLPAPSEIYATLDRYAAFGLPLQITELDVDIADEEQQAEYFGDLLTIFFSHPAVDSVILWGFWAGRHWRPEAALFREDWTPRPLADTWRDLVLDQWRTREEATTDPQGNCRIQGFHGRYRLAVELPDGTTVGRSVTLPAAGAACSIEIPDR